MGTRLLGLVAGLWLCDPGRSAVAAPGQSFEDAKSHWSYRPLVRPEAPPVRDGSRVQSPLDAFLLAKLEAKGLTFSPRSEPRALLRRIYYDLIGLPPSFEEVERFERDPSPASLADVVDRLLADPGYGERWGRHWLDVARYADTKDLVLLYGRDALRPYAYTYRDYVIRAFSEDLPFDQFVVDQLAADLAEPKRAPWRLAALGFLTLGRLFDNNVHDQIDDQIDTVSRGLLGLTVACARCHDHKYDAILMDDYYGLYGVFASAEQPYVLPRIEDPREVPGGVEFECQLAKAQKELEDLIDAEFAKLTEALRRRIGDYLVRAATTPPDITETTQFALSLIPEDYRPTLMLRTRRILEARLKEDDRVFGPWASVMPLFEELASDAVEGAALAGLAARVRDRIAARAGAASWNPVVVAALGKAAPTNAATLARAYGDVLLGAYDASKDAASGGTAPDPEGRELVDIVAGESGLLWFPRRDTPDHMSRPEKDKYNSLVLNLDKLAAHASNAPPARAMVVNDLPRPFDPRVFVRGNPGRPGRSVPRAFPRVLTGGESKPFARGSGRLELAQAIASRANPLTARVLVNRVWMEHFGEPLVSSTSDFGVRSEAPVHPELLDWLACEFMDSGWRLKSLHRLILLSSAYQQASVPSGSATPDPVAVDPDNRLLWHQPRRRLDLESMRDSLLVAGGRLDATRGGRPVDVAGDPLNRRRTVYGLVDRQNLPGLYRAFDFAVPDQCVERRPRTTVPQQALFALNSPFILEQARAVVSLPEIAGLELPEARVVGLFRRVLGRDPSSREVREALDFVETGEAGRPHTGAEDFPPWAQLAQVLLVSNEAVFID